MNIISFSVWGNSPLYIKGIKENIDLAKEYYPGWICKIYYDDTFDESVINGLEDQAIFEKIPHSRGKWDGLFWRFYPASDPNVKAFIVRDLDSRLNSREAAAVKDWINSDFDFHGMRDNISHNVPIMGGMWGCRNGILLDMVNLINSFWKNFGEKGTDQTFLSEYIWSKVREKAIVHDKYWNSAFLLPGGEILTYDNVAYYNSEDNCGKDRDINFPRGKIIFKDGRTFQRLDVYEYHPKFYFGNHLCIPFPEHPEMKHGTYVGEDIKV